MKKYIDQFFNWLGYISHKEHGRRYDIVVDAYEKKIKEIRKEYSVIPRFVPERRIGNSTRLADYYIQELFTKKKITIIDHHPTREASRYLFKTISRRLLNEHMCIKNIIREDRDRLTIELKD